MIQKETRRCKGHCGVSKSPFLSSSCHCIHPYLELHLLPACNAVLCEWVLMAFTLVCP